jgi:hypothetical protein
MAYGLKVYDASGNVRLDTTDRECRYVGFYTGSVASSSTSNIAVTGMSNDGTWGINELSYSNFFLSIAFTSSGFSVTNSNNSSAYTYKVQVFRI